jgi:glycosyltransferase involved in cell wall biosynthesis
MDLAAPYTASSVSVVIPAYNYAQYLPCAIDSVLGQTHPPAEVIVVDDGSTDATPEVCARYGGSPVRRVHQSNAGLSAARNTGWREARTSLVAFLDADDRWEANFLAAAVDQLNRLGPDFAAVGTATARMDGEGRRLPAPRRQFLRTGELTSASFCLRNRPLSSSIVLKRQVLEESGGFDRDLRSAEDRDMWIRLTARGHRFYYLEEPLALIRRHPQNMSKNAPRMKRNSGLVLRQAWRAGAVPRVRVFFWLRAAAIHYFLVAWTHFDDGLRGRAWIYLLISIAVWPVFLRPGLVAEPPLFRLRAALHFLRRTFSPVR